MRRVAATGARRRVGCHASSSSTAARSSSSSWVVASIFERGEVVVLDALDDLDASRRSRAQWIAEDEPLGHAVAAGRGRGDRGAELLAGRPGDLSDGVDDRIRRAGCGALASRLDDRRAPLLDIGDELAAQPLLVADHLRRGPPADARVPCVGELRRRVVAPDGEIGDIADVDARLCRQLGPAAALVQHRHREPSVLRHSVARGRRRADQRVRVARVADDEHAAVVGGVAGDRGSLSREDAAVDAQEVLALHALPAGHRPDQQGPVRARERRVGVGGRDHLVEQRECAILELHPHALQCGHRRLQLEQLERHRCLGSEGIARRDPEEERVSDLSCGAGHGDANGGVGHRSPVVVGFERDRV